MESITAVRGELDGLVLANPVHVQKGGIVALLIKAVIASAMAACSAPTSQKNADAAAHARRRSSTPLPSKVRTVLRASRLQPDRQAAKVGAWRTNRAIGCSPSPSSSSSPPCRPGSRGSPTFANVRQHREQANPQRLSDRHQRFHGFVGIRIPEVPERFSSFVEYHVSSGSKLRWVSLIRPFPPNIRPSSPPTTKSAPRPRQQRRIPHRGHAGTY